MAWKSVCSGSATSCVSGPWPQFRLCREPSSFHQLASYQISSWIQSDKTQLEYWAIGPSGKCGCISYLLSPLRWATRNWRKHSWSIVWWMVWSFSTFAPGCCDFLDSRADQCSSSRTGRSSDWFGCQSCWRCSSQNCQRCCAEFEWKTATGPWRTVAETLSLLGLGLGRCTEKRHLHATLLH